MMATNALQAFWSADLGCRPEDFASGRTLVVPCGTPHYQGLRVFAAGKTCIVSVLPDSVPEIGQVVAGQDASALLEPLFWQDRLGGRVERVGGPAFLGTVDRTRFRPADPRGTRLLTDRDLPALRELEAACQQIEWEHSSIEWGNDPVFGCCDGGSLASAGTLEAWGPRLRHIGIITHPRHRGKGYGRAVVSAMTQHALEQGCEVQYRTLAANAPSMAIARSLGFRRFATSLALRLARPPVQEAQPPN